MADREWGFRTRALHAGGRPDPGTGARTTPIYYTSAFVFEDTDDAADLFALQKYGSIYTRISNPTVNVFEERMANLEGGIGAVATSSGQSAQFLAITSLAGAGDHIVSAAGLYGGTYMQFDVTLRRLGIETTFVRSSDPDDFAAAIGDRTKLLFTEIIANPAARGRRPERPRRGRPRPRPAAGRGLDVRHPVPLPAPGVRGRHRRALGHEVPVRARHDHRRGGRRGRSIRLGVGAVPELHRAGGQLQRAALVGQLRRVRLLHAAAGRADARRGRLPVALRRLLPAGRASRRCRCAWTPTWPTPAPSPNGSMPTTGWPGCAGPVSPDHPHHERAQRYLPKGPGSIFTFGVEGGRAAGARFIEALQLVSHLANVGDAKTLVIHPASTTHQQLSEDDLAATGVSADMVRLSVGLEDTDDIIWDLDQALAAAVGPCLSIPPSRAGRRPTPASAGTSSAARGRWRSWAPRATGRGPATSS